MQYLPFLVHVVKAVISRASDSASNNGHLSSYTDCLLQYFFVVPTLAEAEGYENTAVCLYKISGTY